MPRYLGGSYTIGGIGSTRKDGRGLFTCLEDLAEYASLQVRWLRRLSRLGWSMDGVEKLYQLI